MSAQQDILDFWFGSPGSAERDAPRKVWFKCNPAYDAEMRESFLQDQQRAAAGEYDFWTNTPDGSVALLLLLDQFPRNLYRNTPQAFTTDARSRELSGITVPRGFDQQLPPVWRWFVYLPFEHGECLADQARSLALFGALPATPEHDEVKDYAKRHYEVIKRFSRFPHRNAILGRQSTSEELEFLKQQSSTF